MRGRVIAPAVASLAMAGALLLAGHSAGQPARGAGAHPERPPARHSGGFGEPTCHACHFDFAADAGTGKLTLVGVPAAAEPSRTYTLEVRLQHPGMSAAGFQLAARHEDGSQAGSFTAEGEDVAVTVDGDVAYAHHTLRGSRPASADSTGWILRWTAPASGGAVRFHAAAIAGDGDISPLGDHVYTLQQHTPLR